MCLTTKGQRLDAESETLLPQTGGGFDVAPIAFQHNASGANFHADHGITGTLRASGGGGGNMPAVAFDPNQITSAANRSQPRGDVLHTMPASSTPPHLAQQVTVSIDNETLYPRGIRQDGDSDASAQKADAGALLRVLRDQVGEEAFTEWGLGILNSLQPSQVLRSEVYGGILRASPESGDELDDDTLPRAKDCGTWTVQSLWRFGCSGCAPSGWRPSEQLARQLGAYLSLLSREGASPTRLMLDLWKASEGIGLLRQALSTVQEAWRPNGGEGQSKYTTWQVRRLTPRETERLQGFPDDFTKIPYRGKPADQCPDGPRYKAIGNSWAVNVADWIGERIAEVDQWTA